MMFWNRRRGTLWCTPPIRILVSQNDRFGMYNKKSEFVAGSIIIYFDPTKELTKFFCQQVYSYQKLIMKNIFNILVFALALANVAFSQTIVRFGGQMSNGNYLRLDSVVVENLTRSWTETLVYPDTVLVFSSSSISHGTRHSPDSVTRPHLP